jgi:hypothetical protein
MTGDCSIFLQLLVVGYADSIQEIKHILIRWIISTTIHQSAQEKQDGIESHLSNTDDTGHYSQY